MSGWELEHGAIPHSQPPISHSLAPILRGDLESQIRLIWLMTICRGEIFPE